MDQFIDKRPWGMFEQFTLNEQSTVKIITVNPNSQLSYQYHKQRTEFWRIISGSATVILDDKEIPVSAGDDVRIPQGTKHRILTADDSCVFLEISFGHFDEEDNIRLKDDYGRA